MVCDMMFICPQLDFGIHVIGSILKQYKPFSTPHVRLKLIMRWCVQNLSTFNDGTNYRPVSIISNLTETIMSLIEETDDTTHERTGQGELGAASPPSHLPPPKFQATQFFWAATEILAKPIFTKVSMFCFVFFFFESDIFLF